VLEKKQVMMITLIAKLVTGEKCGKSETLIFATDCYHF